MNLNAEKQFEQEQDHIRKTLTDLIHTVGEVKTELNTFKHEFCKFRDYVELSFEKINSRLDRIKKCLDRQGVDNAEIKAMLATLIARRPS